METSETFAYVGKRKKNHVVRYGVQFIAPNTDYVDAVGPFTTESEATAALRERGFTQIKSHAEWTALWQQRVYGSIGNRFVDGDLRRKLAALIGGIQRIAYPPQPHTSILVVAADAGKTWYTFTDVAEVRAVVAGRVELRNCRIPF